jgi:medium-chain acyl-[acyl-carrier-protein] hydrolase
MIDELAPILAGEVAGSPYVFFGHSLGALVAFAVCREFRRSGTALPSTLIVSGAKAPHLPPRKPPIYDLPEPEFIEELRRMEGTPEEALANKELMEVLIPMLRADCAVSETYNHKDEPPLPCPIVAFGGEGDEDVPAEDVYAWRAQTSAGFEAKIFPGGHFFMHEHETDVVNEVKKHLAVR